MSTFQVTVTRWDMTYVCIQPAVEMRYTYEGGAIIKGKTITLIDKWIGYLTNIATLDRWQVWAGRVMPYKSVPLKIAYESIFEPGAGKLHDPRCMIHVPCHTPAWYRVDDVTSWFPAGYVYDLLSRSNLDHCSHACHVVANFFPSSSCSSWQPHAQSPTSWATRAANIDSWKSARWLLWSVACSPERTDFYFHLESCELSSEVIHISAAKKITKQSEFWKQDTRNFRQNWFYRSASQYGPLQDHFFCFCVYRCCDRLLQWRTLVWEVTVQRI